MPVGLCVRSAVLRPPWLSLCSDRLATGLSFLAIRLSDQGDYSEYIKHVSVGFYLAVIAFLLAAIGAAIGPSRVR